MNIQGVISFFGTTKQFSHLVGRETKTLRIWKRQGIPIRSALAVADVLTQQARKMEEAAQQVRDACYEAGKHNLPRIKEF